MSEEARGPGGVTCIEIVELVTDYVEGALSPAQRARFEEHLSLCPPCREYLAQIQTTINGAAGLTEEEVPPPTMDALIGAFRNWRRD